MFGKGNLIRTLEARVKALEQENQGLQSRIAGAESRAGEAEARENAQINLQTAERRLFEQFRAYRDSLGQSQETLGMLAKRLRDEKQETVRAGGLAAQSNAAVQGISRELTQLATDSRMAMDKVVGLETSAEKIGGIVNLIKEIADQTNLLALNAAKPLPPTPASATLPSNRKPSASRARKPRQAWRGSPHWPSRWKWPSLRRRCAASLNWPRWIT
jgi:methyl-accepting chemotaxis protein